MTQFNMPVGAAPALVITAPAATYTSAYFVQNLGAWPVYIGGIGVTPQNGIQLQQNNTIDITGMFGSVYACTGYQTTSTSSTASVSTTANTSQINIGSLTNFATGSTFVVGVIGKPGSESAAVATIVGTTAVTTAVPLQYAHAAGEAVTLVTSQPSNLSVAAGVI